MTREEAIDNIKHSIAWAAENHDNWCDSIRIDALRMALEALEQPVILHCKDCKFNRNNDSTTDCEFHTFWCSYDDGYCNFGQRKENVNDKE